MLLWVDTSGRKSVPSDKGYNLEAYLLLRISQLYPKEDEI